MQQCAEQERIDQRRRAELQSSTVAHTSAPGSTVISATMQVGMGRNPEWNHYRHHQEELRVFGVPSSICRRVVPEYTPRVRLQLEAFRIEIAGGQEAAPPLWRQPQSRPSYHADGSYTTAYLTNGSEMPGNDGMCFSDPNPYTRPCLFCKRDREALPPARESLSAYFKREPPRKRRKVGSYVSVSLYTGGFLPVGAILQVRPLLR